MAALLEALQLAADALLNCWADDEDANLNADSAATTQAIADLREAQRRYSNAVTGKEPAAKKKKDAAKPAKDKGVAGPSKAVARNVDDPRQALLHHAESLVELGKAKTEGLKAAARVFHTSVDKVLDDHQSGLEDYVNTLKFLVGTLPPSLLDPC